MTIPIKLNPVGGTTAELREFSSTDAVPILNGGTGRNDSKSQASAWVFFNGTGTPSIYASFNVSSITKISTGIYDIMFTTPMDNTNFCFVGMTSDDAAVQAQCYENGINKSTRTLDSCRIVCVASGGTTRDFTMINGLIFGGKDL